MVNSFAYLGGCTSAWRNVGDEISLRIFKARLAFPISDTFGVAAKSGSPWQLESTALQFVPC